MAREWRAAMDGSSGSVSDFVAVGNVEIRVIGAHSPILDTEVPVRQLLEQIIAKLGVPPFLLGLHWSTTERMSKQQADLLTSEAGTLPQSAHPGAAAYPGYPSAAVGPYGSLCCGVAGHQPAGYSGTGSGPL